ncbi:exodeoxyribonuclease VII small subunit [Mongoliitalea daihaiensis]|uniref:exodeoxyribonuclease VII small subunit n=1 Tax=Mongoliitalea daihaiensis TaxID=2782006 RepID=UPI001F258D43|nr:exodeoxyribonuclease VII small subunit [Mongoliitalea daihaiensis]UJP63504.1 exodeoxyribonuclease VII small subunit [Mongoliitalea daihaiensis]
MEIQNLSYDSAIKRIQEIVETLEKGEKGIDELTALVKEASDLMKFCRKKLRTTEEEVNLALGDDFEN